MATVGKGANSELLNIASATTDGSIVAAATNRRVRVLAVAMVAGSAATNITFNTKGSGAGTAISPLFANAANGGAVLPYNPAGWFTTNLGEALTATSSASGQPCGILITFQVV